MSVGLPADVTAAVLGRRRELRLLLSALERGKAVLLLGLPGVSKTTMVRALARHLGDEADRFVDVTGDEQLTGHALVGTFDPPMVLKEGYRPDHFVPGPLTQRGAERADDGAVGALPGGAAARPRPGARRLHGGRRRQPARRRRHHPPLPRPGRS